MDRKLVRDDRVGDRERVPLLGWHRRLRGIAYRMLGSLGDAEDVVRANASATEPARLLAVLVAEDGAELTTFDR